MEDDIDIKDCCEDPDETVRFGSVGTAVHSRGDGRLSSESGVVVNFAIIASRLVEGLVSLLSTKQTEFCLWGLRTCLGVESRCLT